MSRRYVTTAEVALMIGMGAARGPAGPAGAPGAAGPAGPPADPLYALLHVVFSQSDSPEAIFAGNGLLTNAGPGGGGCDLYPQLGTTAQFIRYQSGSGILVHAPSERFHIINADRVMWHAATFFWAGGDPAGNGIFELFADGVGIGATQVLWNPPLPSATKKHVAMFDPNTITSGLQGARLTANVTGVGTVTDVVVALSYFVVSPNPVP